MRKFITDNSGLRYYLELVEDSEDLFWVNLWRKDEWVGHIKYQTDHINIIIAGDVYIRDDSDPLNRRSIFSDYASLPAWIKKNVKVTEVNKHFKNYRHQGLGTKLLTLLIEHAREKNVQRIYGNVMKDDIGKTPGLIEWYERHGFQRCGPYQGCIANAAVWLLMDLT